MDGPYRDIGSGFVRLSGLEAPRRARSQISCVEDVLQELLNNARDARAQNVYVATSLKSKRFRTLLVLDDGEGVPESHAEKVFDPGVTGRHLESRSGLALYHVKNAAVEARLTSNRNPTAVRTVLDTKTVPERALQSGSRESKSNLLATARAFATESRTPVYLGSQSAVLATLFKDHIIHTDGSRKAGAVGEMVRALGFEVSSRTLKRVLSGEIEAAREVSSADVRSIAAGKVVEGKRGEDRVGEKPELASLFIGERDKAGITAILREAAAANYLALGAVRFDPSPGRMSITAEILEPEEEYDG